MLNKEELTVAKQVLDIVGGSEGYLKEVKTQSEGLMCRLFPDFWGKWVLPQFRHPLKNACGKFLITRGNIYDDEVGYSTLMSTNSDQIEKRYEFLKWLEQQV